MKRILILILSLVVFTSCNSKKELERKSLITPRPVPQIMLPNYKIHDLVRKLDGNKFADIIIPSLSPKIRSDSLSQIAFAIIKKERIDEAEFYSTAEAAKAMYSVSYLKKHPNALKDGYLGSISSNKFSSN